MNSKFLLFFLATVSCILPTARGLSESVVTFEILAAYDYPGFHRTYAAQVNDEGWVAGSVDDQVGHSYGYYRSPSGHFSELISNPDGDGYYTIFLGINDLRQACGSYSGGPHPGDAFLLAHHQFINASFPGSLYSDATDLNDAGDFCGDHSRGGQYFGFVNIGGSFSSFEIPGLNTWPHAINNLKQCVGYYGPIGNAWHGFLREADGTLIYPIDAPVVGGTSLSGINDHGWMVGGCYDYQTGAHAVVFIPHIGAATYDFPGAEYTWFSGINNKRLVVGGFVDAEGEHSLLLRVIADP